MNREPSLRKRIGLELFRKMRRNNAKLHEIDTIFWECTLRCNLSCRHCGSDCRAVAHQPDMPVADFLNVIDKSMPHLNPNKTLIIFTGGEVLVRNDIETCGLELYRRGFPWGIVTNGLLMTQKRFDSLLSAGLHAMTVSLDGFEHAHNWLRNNDASFEKALGAIKMLTQTDEIKWDVVTCVNQKNISQLSRFKEFLIETGVRDWRIFTIFPVGRAAGHGELQISDKHFTHVLDFIKDTRKEGKIHLSYGCEGFLGDYEMEVRDHFYECRAGVSVVSILSDGSISACPSIRFDYRQGNIYRDDFMTVWNERFEMFRNRAWAKKGVC
ncbi:MAG: TIGR04133 family radical SAM/SPASM protein, partial [Bacteroidales bacterium]|nr:TIGR04133 family radical SAM/SPASM protein [Bacteroidales bacterium]